MRRSSAGRTRRLLLAACAAIALAPTMAHAQTGDRVRYNITSRDLGTALTELARQSNREIYFPADLTRGRRAPRLTGQLTVEQALDRLLQGTGLRYRINSSGAITIESASGEGEAGGAAAESVRAEEQEIFVTGTNIRGAAPVGANLITLDRETIDRSGFTTVQDAIRSLPQNFNGGVSEDTVVVGPTTGNLGFGTGVNLRGLGNGATLILINGRRLAPTGQDGAFVDISSVPVAAVSRIDVLTDGASALYGSDAIGGVVNVILRRNYDGAETRFRVGTVTEGSLQEYFLSQAFGTSWATGSALLSLQFRKRDNLPGSERIQFSDADLRRFGGDDFRTRNCNPGTIVIGTRTWAIPTGQNGRSLTPGQLTEGTVNRCNQREGTDYLPQQKSWNVFGTVSQHLSEDFEVSADLLVGHRHAVNHIAPGTTVLTVSRTNPFYVNPTGGTGAIQIGYNFLDDFGPFRSDSDIDTINGALAARVDVGGSWQVQVTGGYATESLDLTTGAILNTALTTALNDPNPATAFNPFGDGSFTNPATLAALRGTTRFSAESELLSADLKADGVLARIRGNEIRLAIGLDRRLDTFEAVTVNPANPINPNIRVRFDRNVTAAFAEILIPIFNPAMAIPGLRQLDISAAARYERYSDFGETTTPKVGVAWMPIDGLGFRGTWSRSFRAPNLSDLTEINNTSLLLTANPPLPGTSVSTYLVWTGKNADLQEETAETWTAGVDFSPRNSGLRLGLTYFNIEYSGRVANATTTQVLRDAAYSDRLILNPTAEQRQRVCDNTRFFGAAGACLNTPIFAIADLRLRNTARTKARGLDVQATYSVETSAGRFGAGINASRLFEFSQAQTATSPVQDALNTVGNPLKFQLRSFVSWDRGGFSATIFGNHASAYRDVLNNPPRDVDSWTTFDLQLGYRFQGPSAGWLNGTRIALNVQNVLDEDAPFVNDAQGIGFDPANGDLRGRFISLQIIKEWGGGR